MTAAIRAVEAAGHVVARIEIERDGKIVVILAGSVERVEAEPNEWDELLAGEEHRD